jgi:hypothetical protein
MWLSLTSFVPGAGALLLVQVPVGMAPAVRIVSSDAPSSAVRRAGVNVSNAPLPQNEVAIAFDREDPLNLVLCAHDYVTGSKQTGVWRTFDGGKSWTGDVISDLNPALAVNLYQGDPSVAAHRAGVFYCSFVDHDAVAPGANNRLVVARSGDGGVTWPGVSVVVDNSGEAVFEDKPFLAVDDTSGPFDGTVYLTWVHLPVGASARILLARSTDGGASFDDPVRLNSGPGLYTGPVPAVGPDGEVCVVWTNGNRLEFSVSTDGGATFTVDRTVTTAARLPTPLPGTSFRVPPFASLAIDRSAGPDRGSLYVVWADATGVGHGPDALLVSSRDLGATWSTPVRVSDDTNGSYQFFPWVAVGPDGAVNVVFHDQRVAPVSPFFHTYLARSTDGGRSFERNIRLSDEISDSRLDGFAGAFIGDYIGITASSLGVYPTWTDIRPSNGQAEIYIRPLRFGAP